MTTAARVPSVPHPGEPRPTDAPPLPTPDLKPAPPAEPSTRPSEARAPRPEPKTPEPKTIDQPERFQQDQLEKLQPFERKNLGNVSLSEAIQLADSNPETAIHGFRQAIKADPYNIMAHAWLGAVLYEQGRIPAFVQEIREAHRLGILRQMAARNIRFRVALNQARFNRKLPDDLAE